VLEFAGQEISKQVGGGKEARSPLNVAKPPSLKTPPKRRLGSPRRVNLSLVITRIGQMSPIVGRPRSAFLLIVLSTVLVCGQNTAPAQNPRRATSTPYTGDLSVFDSPGRAERLHINRVMDILGIVSGKGVADIGAGSGWFTVRAARQVGSSGTVYAVDINPKAIRYVDRRLHRESLANVKTILSKPDDPMLPKEEVADPVALLEHLRPALRPGARLGIIDRNGNGTDHGVSRQVVIDEARRAGYRLVQSYDFVKDDGMDYFLVFNIG
jgi:Met-10+ like-protein